MSDKRYLLAWFSDDSLDPNLRYITKEGLGSPCAHKGRWFTTEEVRSYVDVNSLFIILIPSHTVACRSFT